MRVYQLKTNFAAGSLKVSSFQEVSLTTIFSKFRTTVLRPFLFTSLLAANAVRSEADCLEIVDASAEDICRRFPQQMHRLFANLDLNRLGLEDVKAALQRKSLPAACAALLAYYRDHEAGIWLCQPLITPSSNPVLEAELILKDTFTFQRVKGVVGRHENGLLDWSCQGPEQDREWAWFLNRHYHLNTLFAAYNSTGNLDYVRCISHHLVDWIVSSSYALNPSQWAQWRGLEVAYRILHWAPIFFGLQQVEALTPAVRLLMLSNLLDHVFYLRFMHDWGDNWVFREMNGLSTIAIAWPEFKQSEQWLTYATNQMAQSLHEQVYPDGVHKELTSHYHWISLRDLQNLTNLLDKSGHQIPPTFKPGLEQMWNYLAYTIRPDGHSLLNNDSDQENHQPLLAKPIDIYQREDWRFIVSNGRTGQQPAGEASVVFPWAGQLVMRSGWETEAHWAFFDVGPLGINYHEHQDKLHLSLAAYGRDLLVDSGRHSYVRDDLWHYFRGSAGHNVILIDGQGQGGDLRAWQQPMRGNYVIAPEFDFVWGMCDRGFRHLPGQVSHSRAIVYLRGQYWIVVDQISSDRRRQIEPLWHFHPDCSLAVEGKEIVSTDQGVGNLRIIPVADLDWQVKIVKGEKDPVQGWWSPEYGDLRESPTAIYQSQITTSTTFAWVLFPAQGRVPTLQVQRLPTAAGVVRLRVAVPGQEATEIVVQLRASQPIELADGCRFEGNCAILRPAQAPLVAFGSMTDKDGMAIAQHP